MSAQPTRAPRPAPSTPAPSSASAPATASAAPSAPEAADETGAARGRIDALDARIIDLVRERREISAGIQRARLEAGGRRVQLARELEVLEHYRDALGRPGTQLAMTLLGLCRGGL